MSEEKRQREAGTRLKELLNEAWKVVQRRRKMRSVCFDELPWRCHMNLISAECHFQLCFNAFEGNFLFTQVLHTFLQEYAEIEIALPMSD